MSNDRPIVTGEADGRGVDVLDADEEGDQVVVALQRADRCVERVRNAGVDERVSGEGALTPVGPAEELTEEVSGGVRVTGTDLCVHNRVAHGASLVP